MPPHSEDGPRWSAPLSGRIADEADAAQVADAVTAMWHDIERALQPVIGHRGVAALYLRSLLSAAAAQPWLAAVQSDPLGAADPQALHAALARRSPAEAAAAGMAVFDAFRELLASLVGSALTDRLLHSAWTDSSGDPPAQAPTS